LVRCKGFLDLCKELVDAEIGIRSNLSIEKNLKKRFFTSNYRFAANSIASELKTRYEGLPEAENWNSHFIRFGNGGNWTRDGPAIHVSWKDLKEPLAFRKQYRDSLKRAHPKVVSLLPNEIFGLHVKSLRDYSIENINFDKDLWPSSHAPESTAAWEWFLSRERDNEPLSFDANYEKWAFASSEERLEIMRKFIDAFERQRDAIRVACFSFSEFDPVPAQLREKKFEKLGLTIFEILESDQFKLNFRPLTGRGSNGDMFKIEVLDDSFFYRLGIRNGDFLLSPWRSFDSTCDFLASLESASQPKNFEILFLRFSNLIIEKISKESPASAFGFKVNDAVLKVNGKESPNARLFMHHLVNKWKDPSKVKIERAGSTLDLSLKLDSKDHQSAIWLDRQKTKKKRDTNWPSFWHGITFSNNLTSHLVRGNADVNSISFDKSTSLPMVEIRGGVFGVGASSNSATVATIGIKQISNLSEIEKLALERGNIKDIAPLSGLINLNYLRLSDNKITDIGPLEKLTKLTYLQLRENNISDVTPLLKCKSLRQLYLNGNNIKDITPLISMSHLKSLNLKGNPISKDQMDILRKTLKGCRIDF